MSLQQLFVFSPDLFITLDSEVQLDLTGYLLHVQGQVCGQNSPLDHLQSGLVLVQGQAAQDLVSLDTERWGESLHCWCVCFLVSSLQQHYCIVIATVKCRRSADSGSRVF